MRRPIDTYARRLLSALAGAAVLAAVAGPGSARATDSYPCGAQMRVSWSSEWVQTCGLTGPLTSNNYIPVYQSPISVAAGATAPAPAAWLHGLSNQRFVCQRRFPGVVYNHPRGWYHSWWAYTLSDGAPTWGWVPETFLLGGANDEADAGLRRCPEPAPAPVAPPAARTPAPPTAPPGTPTTPGPDVPAPEVPAPGPQVVVPFDPATPSLPPAPPAAPSCDPLPAAKTARLHASVGRRLRIATTRYGRKLTIRGRLTGEDGAPLPATSLCIASRKQMLGATTHVAGTVVTDRNGRFAYTLRTRVSQRVLFVHRVDGAAAATTVLVRVRAPLELRVSRHALRNGQAITLSGRLGGSPRPSKVVVEAQARTGSGWQTFGTTSTRRQGRFSYRYRFTRSSGLHRYELRVRVPEQIGYPFTTGGSRPVHVRVIG